MKSSPVLVNRILFGDCCKVMQWLIKKGVRVQTCVTSPPYFGLRPYSIKGQFGIEETPDEYVANMVKIFRLVRELLAEDGTLWLNLGDSYVTSRPFPGLKSKDLIGIPWRVALALQADGWYLRQDIIWSKPNTMPEGPGRGRCTKAHEYVFLLSRSSKYYFDADAISEKAIYAGKVYNMAGEKSLSKYQLGMIKKAPTGKSDRSTIVMGDRKIRRSVWNIPINSFSTNGKSAHFSVMPLSLVKLCILAGSKNGDIVFDPFMGSGSVAAAAVRVGRRYLGSELNKDHKEIQAMRISGAKTKKSHAKSTISIFKA